jgi:hypothetical protein
VHLLADAVADELANDRESIGLDVLLDRVADVERGAGRAASIAL